MAASMSSQKAPIKETEREKNEKKECSGGQVTANCVQSVCSLRRQKCGDIVGKVALAG